MIPESKFSSIDRLMRILQNNIFFQNASLVYADSVILTVFKFKSSLKHRQLTQFYGSTNTEILGLWMYMT